MKEVMAQWFPHQVDPYLINLDSYSYNATEDPQMFHIITEFPPGI